MTTATSEELNETQQEMQTVRQTLALKRAVDQRLNELVRQATELVATTGIATTEDMRLSQFGNVLAVATETGSVEVVKNFVRYQIGRKDGRGWRHGDFGLHLISRIDGWLAEQAQSMATDGIPYDTAWMELVRLYIGYLRRDWVFQRAQIESQKKQSGQSGSEAKQPTAGAEARGRRQ